MRKYFIICENKFGTIHKTLTNHTQTLALIDIATLLSEIIQKQNKTQVPTDDCKNTFESVLMRWMKLEPIIQSEGSQKEKHQYSILTHIYGI